MLQVCTQFSGKASYTPIRPTFVFMYCDSVYNSRKTSYTLNLPSLPGHALLWHLCKVKDLDVILHKKFVFRNLWWNQPNIKSQPIFNLRWILSTVRIQWRVSCFIHILFLLISALPGRRFSWRLAWMCICMCIYTITSWYYAPFEQTPSPSIPKF